MRNGYFGIIDRYIIRKFLSGFVFTILLIVSIAITIDIGERIDKFVANRLSPLQIISEYYINFVPYIIALLGPYFVCITVIFFTSQLATRNEIIAIFNSGVSFKRFLAPYIFSSMIIASTLWYANNYIIPDTNKNRLKFENKYIAYNSSISNEHIHRKINDSTYLYFRVYDNNARVASTVAVERFRDGQLIEKYLAERALWDSAKNQWTFQNYFVRNLQNPEEALSIGESKKMDFTLDPTILVKRWTYIEELTRPELIDKIAELKNQGVDNTAIFECELHRRTANCFGIMILTVIGATLASKKVRGGMGLHLMSGIVLCSLFEVLQKFGISFAIKANFNPIMAVWLPNLLFLMIAWILWIKIQE